MIIIRKVKGSLSSWEGKARLVWFKIFLEHSHWIPVLIQNGFTYHHAQNDFAMLVKWLSSSDPNNLPSFAHNTIGVGVFAVDEEEDAVLVVKERFTVGSPQWKLPGGYVDYGEDISTTAVRELKEETGIDSEFMSILSVRHMHQTTFGCSNLYFIVLVKPKPEASLSMCKHELLDCKWMKLPEFLSHPNVNETNKFFGQCYLDTKKTGISMVQTTKEVVFEGIKKNQTIYHNKSVEELVNHTSEL